MDKFLSDEPEISHILNIQIQRINKIVTHFVH